MIYRSITDLEQDTDAWYEWRRRVIGASDAPIIMGENRWKGREGLINEKMSGKTAFHGNSHTREGKELEGPARQELNQLLSANLQPKVIQSTWSPYLAASLDGTDEAKGLIVEIKCGLRTYEYVRARQAVPSHYVAQVQHILMVARATQMLFAAYRPGQKLLLLRVDYSKSYIDQLHTREQAFAQQLQQRGHSLQDRYLGTQVGATL